MTDTEFNAVKAFLSAYRYTELDLRVRRAELTRLTARKEALILEGNTDLLFHLEHAICAAKDAIRVLCTRQAEIEAAIDTVESAALREILTQHYICALDLKEIAERMHYSDRHMRRLHRKAIESVSLSAVSPSKKRGSSPRALPLVKRI
ncbi:sigma factor-like helix-turn-helix DNA-binding protein [Hominenteromicrobium sp.]|uniref:sigma factor-like helix-turn-helix DNA-binding protein n=1 Tax=Hominenteromicrobium sp. TaxID=3073581 RepID=UPI003A951D39